MYEISKYNDCIYGGVLLNHSSFISNNFKMRILTHNSLRCPAKDVTLGYPLLLDIDELEIEETECNVDFIRHVVPSLDWKGVLVASEAIGLQGIPNNFEKHLLDDKDFILAMHNLLLDIQIVSGFLICPESNRKFPIKEGIPDMT